MFLDIGVGLILTVLVALITNTGPSWTFLLVGLVGALWPDIDFVIWILRGNKVDHRAHRHRDLLHFPCFSFPLLAVFVWVGLGWQFGILFIMTTLAHFIHDTVGHGWGIRWFYPFDNRYLCYRSIKGGPTRLYLWTWAEQEALSAQYGNPNWLNESYSTINPPLIIELVLMVVGIVAATVWYAT